MAELNPKLMTLNDLEIAVGSHDCKLSPETKCECMDWEMEIEFRRKPATQEDARTIGEKLKEIKELIVTSHFLLAKNQNGIQNEGSK